MCLTLPELARLHLWELTRRLRLESRLCRILRKVAGNLANRSIQWLIGEWKTPCFFICDGFEYLFLWLMQSMASSRANVGNLDEWLWTDESWSTARFMKLRQLCVFSIPKWRFRVNYQLFLPFKSAFHVSGLCVLLGVQAKKIRLRSLKFVLLILCLMT